MKKALLLCLLLTFTAFATEDHQETEYITGSGFDLVKVGNHLTGNINDINFVAEKNCGSFIRGTLGNQEFDVVVKNDVLQGTFGEHQVVFKGVDPANQAILVQIDGKEKIIIRFETGDFVNGHFQGITFSFEVAGESFSIHLDGEACMGSMLYYTIFFVGITLI